MKKIFVLSIVSFLFLQGSGQKVKFDIASFIPPQGWQRIDSNGIVAFLDSKTANGLTSFCQIFLFPSMTSDGNAANDFQSEWKNRVVKNTGTDQVPKTETQKSDDGWDVTTGYANVQRMGITYTCILVTATGFGKEMSVLINVAGENYTASIQKFLKDFDLDSKATATNPSANSSSTPNSTTGNGATEYTYITPENWHVQKLNNITVLSQTENPMSGCLITLFPSEPSTGDLEKDARRIFNGNYSSWEYRYTGEKKEDVSRGYTLQGLPYYMIEAQMQKKRPDGYYYDYEDAQITVIGLGNNMAVIQGRHNRGEMVCFCKYSYENWNRFFNSFTVNKVNPVSLDTKNNLKRIVGSWETTGSGGGGALTEYIFAANGHYKFIGAYSTTSYIGYNLIELKTSGFKGDGTYSLKGNKITITKASDKSVKEVMQYRFDQVNHAGTGWNDRLYLLSSFEGKPFEVLYERKKS